MNSFYGYIRVSTQKQGQLGVSLQEQQAVIERHARQHGLNISRWFEERATAAKRGRPIFTEMLRLLRAGKAYGVIMHKIDRSARNLRDWTELGELIDAGVEVRFATESLDLQTRGGRLSADIQAVVAADYIRNLREEARKGFYGRLNQGVYPLPAPFGYRDMGAGKPKTLDPETAPIVRRLFELYVSGRYTVRSLLPEATAMGLRNRNGRPFSRSGLASLLNNPFYIGLITIKRRRETFPGAHEPLISSNLFEQAQALLKGRTVAKVQTHDFLFRRMLCCVLCHRILTGERQKGHVYYRCHGGCRATCIRETEVEHAINTVLLRIQLTDAEQVEVLAALEDLSSNSCAKREQLATSLTLQLQRTQARLDQLIDAYLDRILSKEQHEERRALLLTKQIEIRDQLTQIEQAPELQEQELRKKFELAKILYSSFNLANAERKREILTLISSNRNVEQKKLVLTLFSPFLELTERPKFSNGPLYRVELRTWIEKMLVWQIR